MYVSLQTFELIGQFQPHLTNLNTRFSQVLWKLTSERKIRVLTQSCSMSSLPISYQWLHFRKGPYKCWKIRFRCYGNIAIQWLVFQLPKGIANLELHICKRSVLPLLALNSFEFLQTLTPILLPNSTELALTLLLADFSTSSFLPHSSVLCFVSFVVTRCWIWMWHENRLPIE